LPALKKKETEIKEGRFAGAKLSVFVDTDAVIGSLSHNILGLYEIIKSKYNKILINRN